MPVRLKSPNAGFPPDGFRFSDPHTGKLFDDQFSDLNHLVAKVIEHRRANPRIYPESDAKAFDPISVLQEIIIQLCADKPQLCEDDARPGLPYPAPPGPPSPPAVMTFQGKTCPKCGNGEFNPVYCATCGGTRVSSWACSKCGFQS